jgi:glutaredoxin
MCILALPVMSLNTGETIMKRDNTLPPIVLAIGKIDFRGNIIPHEWYNHIKTPSGRTDLSAITILAEIIYWYRPVDELDEKTGKPLPLRKKFSSDMFQSSLSYYQTKFGLTKKQVRNALDNLESKGLIKREKRTITTETGMKLSNVLFVEPIPKAVLKITHPLSGKNAEIIQQNQSSALEGTRSALEGTRSALEGTRSALEGTSYVPQGQTYTETSTENSTETTTTTEPKNFSGTDGKNRSSSNDNCDMNNGDSHQGKRAPPQTNKGAQNENATNPPAAVESKQVSSGEYELIFDFALKDFSPEQKQRAIEMLKLIPRADRQSVLDEFNNALSKNTIKSPWNYLSTLVKRHNANEFTPTSDLATLRANTTTNIDNKDTCPYCKSTGQIRFMRKDGTLTDLLVCKHGQQARAYIQKIKTEYGYDFVDASKLPKNRLTAQNCPYCNNRGMLDLRNRSNGKADIRPCSHNPEKIKQLAREKDALIASAKPGFDESPSINSKKRGGGLRKLANVIGGLKTNDDDDDVPF